MSNADAALVIWGTTGRRIQFTKQDLQMPARLKDHPHFNFFERQWDAVAGFWFNRVLKETSLQSSSIDEIISAIEKDIDSRWQRRRSGQALHKKRKRLLQPDGPAGDPSTNILISNILPHDRPGDAESDDGTALLELIKKRIEEGSKSTVQRLSFVRNPAVSVPKGFPPPGEEVDNPPSKVARADAAATPPTENELTKAETCSVLAVLSSKESAAAAIALLHGSIFNQHPISCRFCPQSIVDEELQR